MQVRIGVADAPRDIELDVEDADAIASQIEQAVSADTSTLVWIVDTKGRRVGIPANRIAYLDIAADHKTSVGFG